MGSVACVALTHGDCLGMQVLLDLRHVGPVAAEAVSGGWQNTRLSCLTLRGWPLGCLYEAM